MDLCFIGNSGHAGFILNGYEPDKNLRITATSPGSKDENMFSLNNAIDKLGAEFETYTDYKKMLKQKKPHIAVVDCHFGEHARVAMAALEEGCNVICDKPLATEIHDLEKLYKCAQKNNRTVTAMMTMRFEPEYYEAKKMISNGEIGIVKLINAQKSYKLGERPPFYFDRKTFGGLIPWIAIHGIDLVCWLSGKRINMISALASNKDNFGLGDLEISAVCQYQLEDDIIATVSADYLRPSAAPSHGDDRIRIAGTEGIIEIIGDTLKKIDRNGEIAVSPVKPVSMLEDYVNMLNGVECILSQNDSFYSTYAALCTRNAADDMKTYRMGDLFR